MAPNFARSIVTVLHDFSAGGTERVATRLASAWADSGRAVTIVCGSENGPLRSTLSSVVRVVCPTPEIHRRFFSRVKLARVVDQELRTSQTDILFVPGNYHWPVLMPLVGVRTRPLPSVIAKISNPLRRS